LIKQEFEVQGIRFLGMEECRPCYWMNGAFAPGAHEFLKGRGGLRAKILTNGRLRSTRVKAKAVPHVAVASPFARERAG
jgi:MOSC domain-containing protein YiiM